MVDVGEKEGTPAAAVLAGNRGVKPCHRRLLPATVAITLAAGGLHRDTRLWPPELHFAADVDAILHRNGKTLEREWEAEEGDGEEVSVKHHRRLLYFVLLPPNPPEERESEEAALPMLSGRPLPLMSCVSHHRREATAGALKASSLPDVAVAFAGRKWRPVRSPVAIASGAAHCR
nr:hypothetical protein Iba_chr04bCG13760 [Ipomoea batatas]